MGIWLKRDPDSAGAGPGADMERFPKHHNLVWNDSRILTGAGRRFPKKLFWEANSQRLAREGLTTADAGSPQTNLSRLLLFRGGR